MESDLYGIFTLVGFVSEISLVRCAHWFDFRYLTNSCENPVRTRFPWSNLYIFRCEDVISFLWICCHWVYHWLLYNNITYFTKKPRTLIIKCNSRVSIGFYGRRAILVPRSRIMISMRVFLGRFNSRFSSLRWS